MSRCSYKADGTYLCNMVENFNNVKVGNVRSGGVQSGPCPGIKSNCTRGQFVDATGFCLCTDATSSQGNFYDKLKPTPAAVTLNNEGLRLKVLSLLENNTPVLNNNDAL